MITFDEYGNRNNPSILFLHGAGALDTFTRQYVFAENYHLVVPHLPGAGKNASVPYEPEETISLLHELIVSFNKDKIGIVGHSLGAQIAIRLVTKYPQYFSFAVFLSAWVNPKPGTIHFYTKFSTLCTKLFHWPMLIHMQAKYWHYTKAQSNTMASYAKQITPEVFSSYFEHTLDLSTLPAYQNIAIPMYAFIGKYEVGDMKKSLHLLSTNPHCKTAVLKGSHDFPMRNAKQLNPLLLNIFKAHLPYKNGTR